MLEAQRLLHEQYGVASEVWSVTSYQQLSREALDVERWNRHHPNETPRVAYAQRCFGDPGSLVVAASDYMKILPHSIRPWIGGSLVALGTDGFGRSDARAGAARVLRVDARHVAWATIEALARDGRLDRKIVPRAAKELEIDPDRPDPTRL